MWLISWRGIGRGSYNMNTKSQQFEDGTSVFYFRKISHLFLLHSSPSTPSTQRVPLQKKQGVPPLLSQNPSPALPIPRFWPPQGHIFPSSSLMAILTSQAGGLDGTWVSGIEMAEDGVDWGLVEGEMVDVGRVVS